MLWLLSSTAAKYANEIGLGVNAGHDLDLHNLAYLHDHLPMLSEVSIGHALIYRLVHRAGGDDKEIPRMSRLTHIATAKYINQI